MITHLPAEVAKDAKAHPINYTLKAAGLVSPFIEVGAAYEGVKALIEFGHASFDVGQAEHEVHEMQKKDDN